MTPKAKTWFGCLLMMAFLVGCAVSLLEQTNQPGWAAIIGFGWLVSNVLALIVWFDVG